jgi:hypothetical protein
MDDLSERLQKLGADVSSTVERLTDPSELDASRKIWLQSLPRPRERSYRPILAVAAAGAIALFAGLFAIRPHHAVSFVVGAPPARGAVGEWVAADGQAPLGMRFSEGTSLTLAPGARARVTETTSHGATVLLERGEVTAAVVHADADTRWSLQAGPFEVKVVGTRFDATWDPTSETFTVAMNEGAVMVKGPLLHSGRELRAGERLRVSVRDGAMELRTASVASQALPPALPQDRAPAPTAPAQDAPAPSAAPAPPATPAPSASSTAASTPSAPEAPPAAASVAAKAEEHEPTVHELVGAGKYAEALAAAERAGFGQEIERASSQDLAALADAARYAARPALAQKALLAQRRRFGVRGSSAFVLGKIAADQQGATGDAIRWFETYLSEEPNGALAEQALGRILELSKGNRDAAQKVAARYLARYPSGVHAPLARSLLSP